MVSTIASHVSDKEVWDLGAGDLSHAHNLATLGAKAVLALDKEHHVAPMDDKVVTLQRYFHDVPTPDKPIQVAFLSWPSNYMLRGLLGLLDVAEVVIYLGSNTNGNACGNTGIFDHLLHRELLAYVPHRRNSLIVVGRKLSEPRSPTGEEFAAISGRMILFDDAEKASARAAGESV
jgi:hypothetical protein